MAMHFALTKEVAQKIQQKVDVFKNVVRAKKKIFIGLVSAVVLKKNQYSRGGC
jgi:hypothetical protein